MRTFNVEISDLNNFDNIWLQTDTFSDVENFREFVKSITGSNIEAMKLNLDTERFLTYSYVCLDQEAWNSENNFEKIEHNFIKFANTLPADNSQTLEIEKIITFSKWKYAKLGLTKSSMVLLSSSQDMNNYTILPEEYENQYFYTYILNIYKKIYLKKLEVEFKNISKVKIARKRFIEFTKKI